MMKMAALRKLPGLFHFSASKALRSMSRLSMNSTEPSASGFDNYELERQNFNLIVPEQYNFAADVIDAWASKEQRGTRPSKFPAFWFIGDKANQEVRWSYEQLSYFSKKAANVLIQACRLSPSDRVVVICPRMPEWWLINVACVRSATILIPGTTQLTARDIKLRLQKSRAKCIIVENELTEKVESILGECPDIISKVVLREDKQKPACAGWMDFSELLENASPDFQVAKTYNDDPMTIFFTSGTTGYPKMAEHTHASYGLGHIITARYWLDLVPQDVHWCMSDTGWAKSAWSNVFSPWLAGSCVFVHRFPVFDPNKILEILSHYPISTFCTAPTAYRKMIQENLQLFHSDTLRHCVTAGEPMNPEIVETWLDGTGQLVREGYGQTEAVLMCANYRCIPVKPGSMGKPPPGMDVTVIDNDCQETPPGAEGDIALRVKPTRPPGLFSRYVEDPERTESVYRGDFFLTGDRAYKDEEGYFYFVGRKDDVIISSGYRIGPFEVENALMEHPSVAETAVVSSPDKDRGEVVKAFIILAKGYETADRESLTTELQNFVKDITAPYKYPREIEFVTSFPKTPSDKIRRVALRDREWGRTKDS